MGTLRMMGCWKLLIAFVLGWLPPVRGAACPGNIQLAGHGPVSIIPTGWTTPSGGTNIDVFGGNLIPHMGARAYFGSTCTAGSYNNEQYSALPLLGKTLSFTVDLTGAGCGCNAAFYLVSMHQNTQPSQCSDYYCDANDVCGVSCAEIDIMEANQVAWHSTLHTAHDHNGLGKGYGGGDGFDGPRDWTRTQYGPGASCVDTTKPFKVAVSFPLDSQGTLAAMEVILTQTGSSCPLSVSVDGYNGMAELTEALKAGMTPVVSYWSSDAMLWMDGKGKDGLGPCAADNSAACGSAVKFSDFSLQSMAHPTARQVTTPAPSGAGSSSSSSADQCPGSLQVAGHGPVAIIPTGWGSKDGGAHIGVLGGTKLETHMGARGYFANTCNSGTYSNEQYIAPNLLGKTMRFTTDLSGAGCGCNVAFYLVSMHQNTRPSDCKDYYCDANSVCGVPCAEIDIMEANQYAWHSTLHTSTDRNGLGKGYGGGSNFNGPRDWTSAQYSPGGSCVDTNKPFNVEVSFPTNAQGAFEAMEVTLTQDGKSCPLSVRVDGYVGMSELSAALAAGMTPVFSYWSSDDMLWMDGKGEDGAGPCGVDNSAACSSSVTFSDFSLVDIGSKAPVSASSTATPAPVPSPSSAAGTCPGQITLAGHGSISIIPTGWKSPDGPVPIQVHDDTLVTNMGARGYFAETCTAGTYNNEQYSALKLLGKTLRFTTDISGAGCGCNAAFYLVSMRQNTQPSECSDYYCDANKVCGVSCVEIDIMEANEHAWHSTLHTAHDHNGLGKGYGGGSNFDGPRDWSSSQYGPGGSCIDTTKPFQVSVSFPTGAMEVTLTQAGSSCPLSVRVAGYSGMAELTTALSVGMTPVFSYWSSDDMLWMDGKGADGAGPCAVDHAAACSDSVKFYDFSLSDIGGTVATTVPGPPTVPPTIAASSSAPSCPGQIKLGGHGSVSIIPTGWKSHDGPVPIEVHGGSMLVTNMGARGYFAESCTAGIYSNEQYSALKLLGKTLRFTTDLTGAGCGCNAAFYLVSMRQNTQPSECSDYYCDANKVCGVSCAEIDIMEANQHAWHSTLHTAHDHNGLGKGYGGGSNFDGPRDWSSSQYGPGGSCIDTTKPFEVAVSFPTGGNFEAMEVKLSQDGHSCTLSVRVAGYSGMAELAGALNAGMTPVFSYWSSDDMLWMDGKGADGLGPCAADKAAACSDAVKFYDFSLSDIGDGPSQSAAAPSAAGGGAKCPGEMKVEGHGSVSIIPTGWKSDDGGAKIEVAGGNTLVTSMGARGYFADKCTAGVYSNEDYMAPNLLGKTLSFTTDLTGAGCGCNAAFYLVSMRQNTHPSECFDYYCDANNVCGESCAEIDIMEANQHAWHSTLHTMSDHSGLGKGYGGGSTFNGPRDWTSTQYGPGGNCVDTTKPFNVAVSFPLNAQGALAAMEVTLTQDGHSCPLTIRVDGYVGMAELSGALAAGMTPVFSYWSSDDMLWMDGKGSDGLGPCAADNSKSCSASVKFSDFSISKIGEPSTAAHLARQPAAPAASVPAATCPGTISMGGLGHASIIPTGWKLPGGGMPITVSSGEVVTHMGARGYFGESCTAGSYSNAQYMALKLLGKTLHYTVHLSGAGCGCNAALYLTSMRQNSEPTRCGDHYCDVNKVCGVACAEIDIMEANMFAWHSTLHTMDDLDGKASGLGGGSQTNGPRDWTTSQYAPGGSCVDTTKPFDVAASFPIDMTGHLAAMEVVLSQPGHACTLTARITEYAGLRDLSQALAAGMTPVFAYWSSSHMLWMDGRGMDGLGPCASDHENACSTSVRISNFSVGEMGQGAVATTLPPTTTMATTLPPTTTQVLTTTAAPLASSSTMLYFPAQATTTKNNEIAELKEWIHDTFFSGEGGRCPGTLHLSGHGPTDVVLTGWDSVDGKEGVPADVPNTNLLVPHMGSRAYFAEICDPGTYDHEKYLALKLLGKTLSFTVDLSGAGCGCNVAFYLVSMRQNDQPSLCHDYYCDANKVCGVSCAEVDIMEANMFAWHATLHSSQDHNGVGGGYGGGDGWDGPRDWKAADYSPGSTCVDTTKPIDVSVSFPTDPQGKLEAMKVTLSQPGHTCRLETVVDEYKGVEEISAALAAGMTPVVSYWKSDRMLWLDGKGTDGLGPCGEDHANACSDSVKLSNFAIQDQQGQAVATGPKASAPTRGCPGQVHVPGYGPVHIVQTDTAKGSTQVQPDGSLLEHMGARAYFADSCTDGVYHNSQYMGPNLLGKTLKYTVDLAGAGCGCNVAFYLVAMRQNTNPAACKDYYCDAKKACGVSCAEIDIMEANQFAWHTTLHAASDHDGFVAGFGGGEQWNGPRDFTSAEYGPGSRCIDTAKPFHVAVSFPLNAQGGLEAITVALSQDGHSCPQTMHIDAYKGMAELADALRAGMTPVVNYWSTNEMLWLDGKGADLKGPCSSDDSSLCAAAVKFSDFSLEVIGGPAPHAASAPLDLTGACPGSFKWTGFGDVHVVPTGWTSRKGGAPFTVDGDTLQPHMGSRAYFGSTCTAGSYSNTQYVAPNLLGKTIRFTTDLAGAGCGCNAAFYLVSMRQNTKPSTCDDYYCDANHVCGVSCAEIDIMEANQFAWHSTLHSAHDHNGVGAGYGGGDSWDGPRDFSSSQFAPGGSCIDTAKPFEVAVSFPVDGSGTLSAMEVILTQPGHSCPLKARVSSYAGMAELSAALSAGMTPVVSYWSSDDMLWMDGKGADGLGPCAKDSAATCAKSVKFSGFHVEPISATPATPPAQVPVAPPAGGDATLCPGRISFQGHGQVSLIPTGWHVPGMVPIEVKDGWLVSHMGSRAYFADSCTGGIYNHSQYLAVNLLNKAVKFTVDLSGAGCGCNAAFYMVSMRQNVDASTCKDYYCDANQVCGVSCSEIDLMEANQHSWHSTLHKAHDNGGAGGGFGGGKGWTGPRDWSSAQYGPGGSCVDTNKPFDVEVSFPTGLQGTLNSMDVKLSQAGSSCSVSASINNYVGMAELSAALFAGMTPVVSYWSSNDMLWMDGKGSDGQGPCLSDNANSCAESVKLSGFSITAIGKSSSASGPATGSPGQCPGITSIAGHGRAEIVPTGWGKATSSPFEVVQGKLIPHQGSRAYFADACSGRYNHSQYSALDLLGRTISFTTDLKGAGCGCNAAFYLVSMRQNRNPSTCHDYYCDANKVCDVACAEIDIMEANMFAWHSTLHTASDHNGVGGGYGGGDTWNGPRDWLAAQYAPGSGCIDTALPFNVAASFPVDPQGKLSAMEVKLTQDGKACSVSTRVDSYPGMAELTSALSAGMTPVVSYWNSDDMLWMDGKGSDSQGPCGSDNSKACADSVKLYNFKVETISGAGGAAAPPTTKEHLYFAGQGLATTTNPALARGGHHLLMEVADLVEQAAESTTTQISFDCKSGLANYQFGWSDMKKAWCCQKVNIPCPGAPLAAATGASSHGGCASAFQQCGGQNWNGATCCEDGCKCETHGDFYSQCTPLGGSGTCAAAKAASLTFIRKDESDEPPVDFGMRQTAWKGLVRVTGASLVAMALASFLLATRCRPGPRIAEEAVVSRQVSAYYESLASVPLRLPAGRQAPRGTEAASPSPMLTKVEEACSPCPGRELCSPPTVEGSTRRLNSMREADSPCPVGLDAASQHSPPEEDSPLPAGRLALDESCSPRVGRSP